MQRTNSPRFAGCSALKGRYDTTALSVCGMEMRQASIDNRTGYWPQTFRGPSQRKRDVSSMPDKRPKVLAISSGGGHWVQLLRLRPAFADCHVVFATVKEGFRADLPPDAEFRLIPEASRWNKIGLLKALYAVSRLVWSERPDIVISRSASADCSARARSGSTVLPTAKSCRCPAARSVRTRRCG
jgi:hypothetical protein